MLTIEEIRQAFVARQTALEKCKVGNMPWLEGDSLDAVFKSRSIEFVETLLAKVEQQQSELARLQERVAQLEAALPEAIHLIDDPAHLISDITANARAALEKESYRKLESPPNGLQISILRLLLNSYLTGKSDSWMTALAIANRLDIPRSEIQSCLDKMDEIWVFQSGKIGAKSEIVKWSITHEGGLALGIDITDGDDSDNVSTAIKGG